jgi:hypothetical protein
MRRINKSITRIKSWTNKITSRSMSTKLNLTRKKMSQVIHQISLRAHECSCYGKSYDHQHTSSTQKSHKLNPTRIKHIKGMGVRLENHLAIPVMCRQQPEYMSHMFSNPPSNTYMGRKNGRWLRAGVSEINLRNPALNHTIRRSLHNPFHLTIWPSGM